MVYDRGYFSYAMLYYHMQMGVHPVFRLQKNTFKAIDDFRNSTQTDQIITLLPTKETQRDIRKQYPDIQFKALTIRLIKYTLEGKTYCIGTTLLDERYTIDALKEVYHARRGIAGSRYFCESLFWASQPKQAAKNLTRPLMPSAPQTSCVRATSPLPS
ncbi:transposase [Bathymodiolus platifrons methanotrophic gill symbiont]|uniref:transposase n=1 Tax=Bathymodiolus platifrons methanotrophic gill symbiont TaxID=113268 RepID=UPI001C8E2C3E|nr:transposase [Bathymodiolus platifrons methanotrophic gill symbiont]